MTKFKVGDRVRRTTAGDKGTIFIESGGEVGGIYTVSATYEVYKISSINLKELPAAGGGWFSQFFELVSDKVEEYI